MFSYQGLRNILRERGISLRQLSRDTGITSNCASDLNNDRSVGIDKIAIVCRYLKVPISQVVEITLEEDA